ELGSVVGQIDPHAHGSTVSARSSRPGGGSGGSTYRGGMRTRVAIVVAAVCAAFLVPVPASADRPPGLGRILLTSTAEPATSQFVSWSRTEPRTGQRVVTVAPDGTVRTTAA